MSVFKTSTRIHAVCVSLALLGSALSASAQAPVDAPESSTADERAQRYRAALTLLKAGDAAAAYQAFLELWTQRPSYDVAMALGQIELITGRYDAAARHFAYAEQHVPPTDAEKQKEAILRGYTAATQHVRVVHLKVTPRDARIWVDGEEPEGRTGDHVTLYLRAGKYRLRVQREGYAPHDSVYGSSGVATETRQITLPPLAAEPNDAPPPASPARSPTVQSAAPHPTGLPAAAEATAVEPAPSWLMAIAGGAALLAAGGGVTLSTTQRERVVDGKPVRARGVGGALLLTSLGLSLGASISWQIAGATVDSTQRSVLARNFLMGSSPGQAPVPKTAVVLSLQAISVGLAGLAVWKLVQQSERHQTLEAASTPGLCATDAADANSSCGLWLERQGRVNDLRITGATLLASAGLTHLLGLALAEWWPNDAPRRKP